MCDRCLIPKYGLILTLLSLMLLAVNVVQAGEVIQVGGVDAKFHLNHYGDYVADAKPVSTPEELLSQGVEFKPLDPNSHALIVSPQPDPVWLRFTLQNDSQAAKMVYLSMSYISMDYWDVFIPRDGGYRKIELGDQRPFGNRDIVIGPYVTELQVKADEKLTYYLRAQSAGQMLVPVNLYTGKAYITSSNVRTGFSLLFIGVALGLFLFSLMLGIQTRDIIYIVYSNLVLMRIFQLVISEGSIHLLLEKIPVVQQMSLVTLTTLYTCSSLLFHTYFLRFNEFYPRVNRAVLLVISGFLFIGLVLPHFHYTLAISLLRATVFLVNPFIVASAIMRIIQGYRPAALYLSAVILPIMATSYGNAAWSGQVPYLDTLPIWLGLSFSISLILFSFALSARIKALDNEKLEAENEAMQARIEAQTKSDFLAQMSHEIRTPMNGVLGISELMGKTDLNEQQQKYNRIIHSSGKLLLQVIDDVLDYSKIQAGKMTLEKIQFDPRELCVEMRQIFLAKFEEKGLAFKVDVDDGVPEYLIGDPTRIRQVLFNLVNNAFKFTTKGSITLSLKKAAAPNRYRFSVKDSGVGISESGQRNLFMPYYQTSKSITRKYGGTGLGLSICKQLCELMDGEIACTSKEGEGSTFWFDLPFSTELEKPVEKQTETDKAGHEEEAQNAVRCLHILIAEDNPVNQIVAQGMLSNLGHTFQSVTNGREAVNMIKAGQSKFDLVLMDCDMPELDGISATREIRGDENGKSVPIVALTAHALDSEINNCKQAGMNHHLTKPLKLDDLRALFRSL